MDQQFINLGNYNSLALAGIHSRHRLTQVPLSYPESLPPLPDIKAAARQLSGPPYIRINERQATFQPPAESSTTMHPFWYLYQGMNTLQHIPQDCTWEILYEKLTKIADNTTQLLLHIAASLKQHALVPLQRQTVQVSRANDHTTPSVTTVATPPVVDGTLYCYWLDPSCGTLVSIAVNLEQLMNPKISYTLHPAYQRTIVSVPTAISTYCSDTHAQLLQSLQTARQEYHFLSVAC